MLHVIAKGKHHLFDWIDLKSPTAAELMQVMDTHGLHKMSVLDCLDPHHLPKLERFRSGVFLVVRIYTEDASAYDSKLFRQTQQISLYITGDQLFTIRRGSDGPVEELVERWCEKSQSKSLSNIAQPLHELLDTVVQSYVSPLEQCQEDLEELERLTFSPQEGHPAVNAYRLITRISLIKRMLSLHLPIVDRIEDLPEESRPFFNDLRETLESLLFWATDVQENTGRILRLQLSLDAQRAHEASQKTNHIMRVIAVFSILFLPLNLITAIYGMNFREMPMLQHSWGFWFVLVFMGLSVFLLIAWFRHLGWFEGEGERNRILQYLEENA